jgi:hypothetical protein
MTKHLDLISRGARRFFLGRATVVFLVAGMGCERSEGETSTSDDPVVAALHRIVQHPHRALCAEVTIPGEARCFARARTDANAQIMSFASPSGYGPAEIASAYDLPPSGGSGITVAIVDAQDNPNAESDLAVYRSQFGLPPCTTANGCFRKVNQDGQQGNYPSPDPGWAGEISLDIDMVSAACPSCNILLVEASSATMADLGAAVNRAVLLGANAISNSYGGPENSSTPSDSAAYFNHPGVLITASSGDNGYGASFPATSQYVIAVGGTSLTSANTARGWAEGAWGSGGSGCSASIPKPSWQSDSCTHRMEADVAAVADPNTGVAVYDTYGGSGWAVYGGTSASSPLVAGIFALRNAAGVSPSYPYTHAGAFYDITTGANGSCTPSYRCHAGAGYDGPTGVGTPNGALINASTGGTDAGVADSGAEDTGVADGGAPSDAGSPDSGAAGTCSHPICATGGRLTSTCDSCAAAICARDPYCCRNQWDSVCVGEVSSICHQSCTGGGDAGTGSSCAHPICSTGTHLTSSCDTCAAQVCAADSYCCTTQWDSVCVGEVSSVCGQTCP